jgi:hypothetical protein
LLKGLQKKDAELLAKDARNSGLFIGILLEWGRPSPRLS